jgi:hypothetical protein
MTKKKSYLKSEDDTILTSILPLGFRFRTLYNLRESGYKGTVDEVNNQPSLTIPEQSMSIREIISRYANGLPVSASQRVPIYHGDEILPDPRTLDLAELQDLRQRISEDVKSLTTNLENQKAKAAYEGELRKAEQLLEFEKLSKEKRAAQKAEYLASKPKPEKE